MPFKRDYAVKSDEVDAEVGTLIHTEASFARKPAFTGAYRRTLCLVREALADPSACLHDRHIQTRRKYMASVMRCVC